jgi:hypothetical protein
MTESSKELLELIALMDELLKDKLPNNWNPLTFKEFVTCEKSNVNGYYVSDWSKRYLISGDSTININWNNGSFINDESDWKSGTFMSGDIWLNGDFDDGDYSDNNIF